MTFTTDYLLYTKDKQITDQYQLSKGSYYQIDDKNKGYISPTDADVYCLENETRENGNNVYHFNPLREYLFVKTKFNDGSIVKVGDKPNTAHLTKKITESELSNYNIYSVIVKINNGSFLSYVPIVGSTINTGLGILPGSGIVTDALNVTKNIGTGAANAVTGRGGSSKRKRKTKKNKRKIRKIRKTKTKTRK